MKLWALIERVILFFLPTYASWDHSDGKDETTVVFFKRFRGKIYVTHISR